MTNGIAALTASQRADFYAVHAKFGMPPGALSHPGALDTANFGGRLVLSADPQVSHIAPTFVPFTSMAHLKSMIGTPDEHFAAGRYTDTGVVYPKPLDPDRIAYLRKNGTKHATPEEQEHLTMAAYAYVQGNSANLSDGLEGLLNSHFTPGTLAYISAEALQVQNGQQLVIAPSAAPLVLNLATIMVHGTGQIQIDSVPLTMIAQVMMVAG
ncbi:MAG: hypothetical protein JWN27_2174 [Candidatus Eremiobacteraeota bacterium]|nr:hypothetical protein [Candidatus Eremiobacteraeota bacterium]